MTIPKSGRQKSRDAVRRKRSTRNVSGERACGVPGGAIPYRPGKTGIDRMGGAAAMTAC
jgi:hypothetical protein